MTQNIFHFILKSTFI